MNSVLTGFVDDNSDDASPPQNKPIKSNERL